MIRITKVLLLLCLGFNSLNAQDTTNYVNQLPDKIFRDYCIENFDSNRDGRLDQKETEEVILINLSNAGVKSLAGIEYFPRLNHLLANGNELTKLDVSKNKELTQLYCNNNLLTTLNVTGCTELQTLYCSYNELQGLDLIHCEELASLNCSHNKLIKLVLAANNYQLNYLYCNQNLIQKLEVSQLYYLKELDCSNNRIHVLDLSKNNNLRIHKCENNPGLKLITLEIIGKQLCDDLKRELGRLPIEEFIFLVPYQQAGKWGMMHAKTMRSVIAPRFESLTFFNHSGYAYTPQHIVRMDLSDNLEITIIEQSRAEFVMAESRNSIDKYSSVRGYKGFEVDFYGKLIAHSDIYSSMSLLPSPIEEKTYAIAVRKDTVNGEIVIKQGIIESKGNPLNGFDFIYANINYVPEVEGEDFWFLVKPLNAESSYFQNQKGERKMEGQLFKSNYYGYNNRFGYSIINSDSLSGIIDLKTLSWTIAPQSKIRYTRIDYSTKAELDSFCPKNRDQALLYLLAAPFGEAEKEYYTNFEGVKYRPVLPAKSSTKRKRK